MSLLFFIQVSILNISANNDKFSVKRDEGHFISEIIVVIFAFHYNKFQMKAKQPNEPINILLADDDKDDRFFFENALKDVPLVTNLTSVKDGEELMQYLSENYEKLPDVLFLDINMPLKNGSECLRDIKIDPKLKGLAVVIYSTSFREEIADVFYNDGAYYYLKKVDFTELPKVIQKVLGMLAENPNQPSRDRFVVSLEKV